MEGGLGGRGEGEEGLRGPEEAAAERGRDAVARDLEEARAAGGGVDLSGDGCGEGRVGAGLVLEVV